MSSIIQPVHDSAQPHSSANREEKTGRKIKNNTDRNMESYINNILRHFLRQLQVFTIFLINIWQ